MDAKLTLSFSRGTKRTLFYPRLIRILSQLSWLPLSIAIASASTNITLLPVQDSPIYADDGVSTFTFATNSNGAGETLFVGTNGTGSARRSLIQYDLSVLPQGSVITDAKLTLFCDREPGDENETLSLHTVLEAWSTGTSNSDALGTPGQGAPAESGDSTWYYRSWPSSDYPDGLKWSTAGASFDRDVLASQQVGPLSVGGNQNSVYSWSSAAMVEDLNVWLNNPAMNFGWIMTGNEIQTRSVKRFISSEGRVNNWLKPNLILTVDIPNNAQAVLSLISSGNPADYQQSIDITALLLGGNTPTGTVTFKEGNNVLTDCLSIVLNNGQAVCHINKIQTGSYQITAYYSGDANNGAIASKSMLQTADEPVTTSDTTTTTVLTASAATSTAGTAVSFTASVRGGLAPAGSVTFMDGAQILCNSINLSHRTAICTKATLAQGNHQIKAQYSGDGTNLSSTSSTLTHIVQAGNSVCNSASKPILNPITAPTAARVGESLSLTVTATDCWARTLNINTSSLPQGASFTQTYDSTTGIQTGILTWIPSIADVDKIKTIRFSVLATGTYENKQSPAQTIKISVLPPANTDTSCNRTSKPVLDLVQSQVNVHANDALQFVVTASDCWSRPITLKTSALPVRATFNQSYDSNTHKQTGLLSWQPSGNDVEKSINIGFTASASGIYGTKQSTIQKTKIMVLAPLTSNLPMNTTQSAVNNLKISKAIWHANTHQLEVSGKIIWSKQSNKNIRANALAEAVQLINVADGSLIGSGKAKLSGDWKIIIALANDTTIPNQIEAVFNSNTSNIQPVK